MVDDQKILGERGRALEEEFFRKEDRRLTARLRELKAKEASREELSRISGIKNTAILDRLLELGVHAETLVALPIVRRAARSGGRRARDGSRERGDQPPPAGGANAGPPPGPPSHDLLKSWLERR